jgi:exodeoxyribonuclease-3
MRIATFNINNINKRLPNLLRWLKARKPDIVCLQELKCPQAEFPAAAIAEAGYHAVWRGEPAWNGVAILSSTANRFSPAPPCPAIRMTGRAATSRRRSRAC